MYINIYTSILPIQCATLQHPFEARNQCALIMKIIEASVKLPPSTVISAELRHLILWLLQKDPNSRPSIKDILNEVRGFYKMIIVIVYICCTVFIFISCIVCLPLYCIYYYILYYYIYDLCI